MNAASRRTTRTTTPSTRSTPNSSRPPEISAISGKTSRRGYAPTKSHEALHIASVWAARQQLVLGQQPTNGKSNEITAIPLLLDRLQLIGALVTIHARGTLAAIADTIASKGDDYRLALKAN